MIVAQKVLIVFKIFKNVLPISINTFQLSICASVYLMCKSVKIDQPPQKKILATTL